MSPILVTFTSSSDYNFERSNISQKKSASKKIDVMALIRTLTVLTTAFERTSEKLVFGRLCSSTIVFAIIRPDFHMIVKSVQSTLSHLISTSVPRATFTRFLVEHGLFQYYSQ